MNIKTTKNALEATIITHDGTFHADEVFSTTILYNILENKDIVLCRTSKIPEDTKAFVYDVGLGQYDHHQNDPSKTRENGIMYSSFGLIWKDFGKQYLANKNIEEIYINQLWKRIDKKLVQNIDANDNGQLEKIDDKYDFEILTIPNLISLYNVKWNENQEKQDSNFIEAVEFANTIINKIIDSEYTKLQAKEQVEEAISTSTNHIMFLEQFMPWKEFALESENPVAKEIWFAVFPSNRGGYSVHTVPKENGSFESRYLLPQEWGGLQSEELQKVSGIKSARFCHKALFICSAETKEDALKMAEEAVKNAEK